MKIARCKGASRWWLVIGLLLWSVQVFALTCTSVWGDPSGKNSNLAASGNTLNMSAVSWPFYYFSWWHGYASWPGSGSSLTSGSTYLLGDSRPGNYTLTVASGARVVLYIKGSVTFDEGTRLNEGGDSEQLIIIVDGALSILNNSNSASKQVRINALIYASGSISAGNNNVFNGSLASAGAMSTGTSDIHFDAEAVANTELPGLCNFALTCFNDDFARTTLGTDWAAVRSSGSFTPSIISNRLRLTQAVGNQSTASSLQRLFPAANNRVIVEFDYFAWSSAAGTGADGVAVVFSDATITPQPGSFGGSLGYAQRNLTGNGFAGGWIGIGLDEYGNFSNPSEGRQGGAGFRSQAIAIRGSGSGTTGYRYLAGTTSLTPRIDVRSTTSAAPNHRYRITIDSITTGKTMVSVDRNAGSGYVSLVAPFDALAVSGQAAVPASFLLSLTGSTGGSNNNHEIDNLQVCAKNVQSVGVQVDHFEMIHDNSALTCQPESILIKACANATCSTLVTEPVTATLNPATDWVGGRVVTFSGGSTRVDLAKRVLGTATLGVVSSTPALRPFAVNLCKPGTAALGTNCNLTFADSGLVVVAPDVTASKPDSGLRVRAVRKSDSALECVPAFAGVNRDIAFWSDYLDPGPGGRIESRPVEVGGSSVGLTEPGAVTRTLAFNASGEASSTLRYTDAGLMSLNARYTGSAANGDAGLIMNGAGTFVSVPVGFCVKTDTVCAAGNASCPVFTTAGVNFNLHVAAMGWEANVDLDLCSGNMPTPAFAASNVPLSLGLLAPAGGNNGSLSIASYNHAAALNGQNTLSVQQSEVGVFDFTAGPVTYQGKAVPLSRSAPVGRFKPARFDASIVNDGILAPSCSSGLVPFAYLGQTLSWQSPPILQARALNQNRVLTRNYTHADFLKLTPAGLVRAPLGQDAVAAGISGARLPVSSALTTGTWSILSPGIVRYGFSPLDTFGYSKTLDARIAPFSPQPQIQLTSLVDSDSVTASALPLMLNPLAAFPMRYGRLWLENAYGPETRALALPLRAEYFNGSRFVLNADDQCWVYNTGVAVLTPTTLTSVAGDTGVLSGGVAGSGVRLNAPGAGNAGVVQVSYPAPLWLQDDYRGAGVLASPAATATFGIHRGHDRIIYWKESVP